MAHNGDTDNNIYQSSREDFAAEYKTGKNKNLLKYFFIYLGLFFLAEILISMFAVVPRMISVFPRVLIFSIGLCLIAFAGYIATLVFGCRRLLRQVLPKDFKKIAYGAYGVIFVLSMIAVIGATVFEPMYNAEKISEGVFNFFKYSVIWGFAPMRLFRMFGLDNIYSFLISHVIFLSAITATYYLNDRKMHAKKNSIQINRIIGGRQLDAKKIKPKKTKIKVSRQPRKKHFHIRKLEDRFDRNKNPRKRARTRNIFAVFSQRKNNTPRHKMKFGRRSSQGISQFMRKFDRKKNRRFK